MEYEGIPRIDSISLFPLVPIEPCAELCFVVQQPVVFFFFVSGGQSPPSQQSQTFR